MIIIIEVIVKRVISNAEVDDVLRLSINQLNELEKLKICKNIVIKPNLCSDKSPLSGATIDVTLIESIVKLIGEINPSAEVYIVESNNRSINADKAFKIFGYTELIDKYPNVKLVNISRDKRFYVEIDGCALVNLIIPETLLKMDYFISVTKLKTHVFEKMSGILKNQFGCITKKYKARFHPFMSEILTDLNLIYKPNLCVIDGRIAMEGFGPTDGTPIVTHLLIIGKDPVATDAVAARIMGFSPKSIPHLKYAAGHGVGDMKNVRIAGEDISFNFKFIPTMAYVASRLALKLQRYGQYLCNLGNLIEKVRSATSTVGISYIRKKVTFGFAIINVKNWIFKNDA